MTATTTKGPPQAFGISILVGVTIVIAFIVYDATVAREFREDTVAAINAIQVTAEANGVDQASLEELARIHSDSPFVEMVFGDQRVVFDYMEGQVITSTRDFDAWAYADGVCQWVSENPEIDTVSFATVQLVGAAASSSPDTYALAWDSSPCADLTRGPATGSTE